MKEIEDIYDQLIQRSYGYDLAIQSASPEWGTVRDLFVRNSSLVGNGAVKIPKKIHQIWLGSSPMPIEYVKFASTWRDMHPGWEYKLWTDSDLSGIEITQKNIFRKSINQGMRSDILRYEILRQIGGVYADMDFECIKPIDDFMSLDFFTSIGYDRELQLYIGLLGSIPHHGIMEYCCKYIGAVYAGNTASVIMNVTGVNHFTKQFLSWVKDSPEGVVAFPMEFFYPFPNNLRGDKDPHRHVTDNSYAIHHWGISWTMKRQNELDTRR